jgi:hypothetical protein
MNPDRDKQLEAAIHRELKALPELRAPDLLVSSVLAALGQRSMNSWYRRSWQTWTKSLRWGYLVVGMLLFCGFCYAGWRVSRVEAVASAVQDVGIWFSFLNAVCNTLGVLWSSFYLVVKNLGAGFLVASLLGLGLGYAACLGLGTLYLRLAMAASQPVNTRRVPD